MAREKAYGVCLYKKYNDSYKILLCQSLDNLNKWGFLKGTKKGSETPRQAAVREFMEESSIKIEKKYLEHFFYQKNKNKDVGIFMLDGANVKKLDDLFDGDSLKKRYICSENANVHFFDIEELPKIKKKQLLLIKKVVSVLSEKSNK
ncbi:MAG: NUDIX domain-containing protein [Epsilonproteobacteria bacterium]|nr:NUDIX domain-containing protein [Campylobacterota bacterium]